MEQGDVLPKYTFAYKDSVKLSPSAASWERKWFEQSVSKILSGLNFHSALG